MQYDVPQELLDACVHEDIAALKRLFAQGITLRGSVSGASTIFEDILVSNNKEMALLLVKNGLDPENFKYILPHRMAAEISGYYEFLSQTGEDCLLPITDTRFIEMLLAMGAEVNAVTPQGETALDIALKWYRLNGEYSFPAAIELLKAHGAKRACEMSPEEIMEYTNPSYRYLLSKTDSKSSEPLGGET